jgi:hypothetical protein
LDVARVGAVGVKVMIVAIAGSDSCSDTSLHAANKSAPSGQPFAAAYLLTFREWPFGQEYRFTTGFRFVGLSLRAHRICIGYQKNRRD